ncbi:MAG: hypothetical protein IJY61_00030 [Candidatus Gastranaerophilales bacterium]|nr:hypothetical protein [Candidatus Gastranaerophilales bacterium]
MSISTTSIPILLLSEIVPEAIGTIKYHQYTRVSEGKYKELSFDTIIMDEETLLKTLIERNAENIVRQKNKVFCDCEGYFLKFHKQNSKKPYKLTIGCREQSELQEFVENISSEYTTNTQEVSYNKIKSHLEEQNLTIENEEVFEDNTIVLTVNLE